MYRIKIVYVILTFKNKLSKKKQKTYVKCI